MNWNWIIGSFFVGFVCGWFSYMLKFWRSYWKALKVSPMCPACHGKWDELRKDANFPF
jgi:hypothetical protein